MLIFALHVVALLGALGLFLFAGESLEWVSPLALLSIFLLVEFTLKRAKLPSFLSWFSVCYALLFLLFPAIRPVLPIELPLDHSLFLNYTFLAVAGCHLFLAGYAFAGAGGGGNSWPLGFSIDQSRLIRVLVVLLLINLVAIALKVVSSGSLSAVVAQSRRELKTGHGSLNVISLYLVSVGSFFFPLIAAFARRQRTFAPAGLAAVLLLEILFLLIYRTRTAVVMHLIGLTVGWFFVAPRLVWGGFEGTFSRYSKKQILAIVLVLFCVGMSGLMIRALRGQFEMQKQGGELRIDPIKAAAFGFQVGELNYSTPVMRVLEEIPQNYDYLNGQSYYRLLFIIVPRAVWPDKPQNSQRVLAKIINPAADDVQTIPAGIIGDLYANFGFWGILGMFLFGMIFRTMDKGSGLVTALFLSVSFAMVFHVVRGGFTNPITTMIVYGFVANLVGKYIHAPSKGEFSE